jgi:hypothetical protein
MAKMKGNYGGLGLPLVGQAGVFAVASKLALHGHNVLFPAVDEGYDLMLSNGLRIQVKSCRLMFLSRKKYQAGLYSFSLRRKMYDPTGQNRLSRMMKPYSEVADFFVLWGVEEDRFWILPTSTKNQRIDFARKDSISTNINIGLQTHWQKVAKAKEEAMEERWDLLDTTGVKNLIDGVVAESSLAQKEN